MSDNTQVLAIDLGDGRTLYALPSAEDQGQLTEVFGERSIDLGPSEADVEGHGVSSDIVFDLEGHALTLRLPTPADAATLRRALVAGAVTATIVGAGAIAALQNPPAPAPSAVQAPAAPAAQPLHNAFEQRAVQADQAWDSRAAAGQAGSSTSNADAPRSGSPALYTFHLKKVTDAGL
jgi:hypothetical protein